MVTDTLSLNLKTVIPILLIMNALNIRKESRHPEHSEGSPDAMEMSRKARHDVHLRENYR